MATRTKQILQRNKELQDIIVIPGSSCPRRTRSSWHGPVALQRFLSQNTYVAKQVTVLRVDRLVSSTPSRRSRQICDGATTTTSPSRRSTWWRS